MAVTLTDLANALGVSKMAVSRGKHRLVKTLLRDQDGKVAGLTDLQAALAEWHANGDYTDAPHRAPVLTSVPPPASAPTPEPTPDVEGGEGLASAAARDKHWRAKLSELKFKEAAGELVRAAEVKRAWADLLSSVRTKLLGVPNRLKQQRPHMSVEDVAGVESLIRESLEDLVAHEGAP